MSKYNSEHFFLVQPRDDDKDVDVPALSDRVDETTAKLPYQYAVMPVDPKPRWYQRRKGGQP